MYGTKDPSNQRYFASYGIDPDIGYVYSVEATTDLLYAGSDSILDEESGLFARVPALAYDQEYAFMVCKVDPVEDNTGGGASGDPHIHTWVGESYDYMGECDMVLTRSETFGNNEGFECQIRTKIRSNWSFITATAIKIGQDTLEVHSDGRYYINGRSDIDLVLSPSAISGHLLTWSSKYLEYGQGHKATQFRIDFGHGHGHVAINIFKGLIDVKFEHPTFEDFGSSEGLMGSFDHGLLMGRDGEAEFVRGINTDEYGAEWQVGVGGDTSLFRDVGEGPQYPEQCKLPEVKSLNERRLRADPQFLNEAEEACDRSAKTGHDRSACLYDVLATGDLDLALLPSF